MAELGWALLWMVVIWLALCLGIDNICNDRMLSKTLAENERLREENERLKSEVKMYRQSVKKGYAEILEIRDKH